LRVAVRGWSYARTKNYPPLLIRTGFMLPGKLLPESIKGRTRIAV